MQDPIADEKQAWDEYTELCVIVRSNIRNVIRTGQLLKNLRDTGRFKKLGDGGYDTWESFIADDQLKMSRGYVFQHIKMFDFYVLEMGMSIEEIEKIVSIHLLGDCMYHITKNNLSREDAMEIIGKAQTLSLSDFMKEIKPPEEEVQEVQPPEPQPQLTASAEQVEEQGPYQRIKSVRCEMCNKQRVEYFEDQICQCDGTFHLLNKSMEGGTDHPHEDGSSVMMEGGDQSGQ